MAKVRLDHLTREELEYLVFLCKDVINRLEEALYQVTQIGTTLDDIGDVMDIPEFFGKRPHKDDQAAKILGDLYDDINEIMKEANRLLRRSR
jgi:hypothetical protein